MMVFEDQMGREVSLESFPKRIISLVPSQTELLYYLGLRRNLIGQTVFCIKPENEFKKATKIGGTKTLKLDKIRSLKPDLIIGNKEENEKEQIAALAREFPVWMSDINSISDALDMILKVGVLTNKPEKSLKLVDQISENLLKLDNLNGTVVYLIWNEPYMAVGQNNYIHSVLQTCGLRNLVNSPNERYSTINLEQIQQLQPDYIFLSSEPFPFNEKHQNSLQSQLPNSKVLLVDGEVFSWYGSKMLDIKNYASHLKKIFV